VTIPAGPDALDAPWLEGALRRDGAFPDAHVRGITKERIGEGYGWDGVLARVTIDGDRAPPSVVAKWCGAGAARNEERFSRDIAPLVALATARVFGASYDAASDRALLVLEDVVPARQGDYLAGLAPRDAEVLADAMAALHAPFWGRVDVVAPAWLTPWRLCTDVPDRLKRTEDAVVPFLEIWRARLSSDARAAIRALPKTLPLACEALSRAPATVIHADLHVENVLFRADGSPVVLDWTDVARGPAAVDFAKFLLNAPDSTARNALARASAPRYLDGLARRGVTGYAAADLARDVVHAMTVELALEVRSAVRTDIVRPTHPRVARVMPQVIRNTAEAAAEPPGDWSAA
jgi:streptomycin 6-kinase